MQKKVIIFDLDGTLLDSLKDIMISTNEVLTQLNFPTHPFESYKTFVGDGARKLLLRSLPKECDKQTVDKALELFTQIYSKTIHENTKPYDGIYELLDALREAGFSLNILSNKPHKFTLKYYEIFFKKYNFDNVYGQSDENPKKPDPSTALKIAKMLNTDPQDIYFVGDTSTDIQTANNANMKSVGVLWGIRDKNELVSNGATFIIEKPEQLLDIVL